MDKSGKAHRETHEAVKTTTGNRGAVAENPS